MSRVFSILALVPVSALWAATSLPVTALSPDRAWSILQQGLTSKRAAKRAEAVHALRLLPHDPRAEELAEHALTDPNPNVRAAAARSLGPMGAVSSVPRLKSLLKDGAPNVVLAAAHSLYLLGDKADVYDVDLELLTGESVLKTEWRRLQTPTRFNTTQSV